MLKVNTDYTSKYSKRETLEIISKFKAKLMVYLANDLDLLEVDPTFVSELKQLYSSERNLCFDNSKENVIYELTPYINNQLINYLNHYDFTVNSGLMAYAPIFHRDYKFALNITTHEFVLFVQMKVYLSEVNEINLMRYTESIIDKIALTAIQVNKNMLQFSSKDIKFIHIDDLFRQFPLLPTDMLIKVANVKFPLMFVFGTNGNNKKHLHLVENRISAYGELVGTLFAHHPVNNEVLKLLTVSTVPSVKNLEENIEKNNLNKEDFVYALSTLPEDANSLGFELYFSQLMMYLMQKYSIHEVVASPSSLDVNMKFKNDNLL